MGTVTNRATLQVLRRVDVRNFAVEDYVLNGDISPWDGVPAKYRKLVGDTHAEMDAGEKAAADAAEAAAAADSASAESASAADTSNEASYQSDRAILKEMNQQHNKMMLRINEIEATLNAIKATSGGSDNIRAAIPEPNVDLIATPTTFTRTQDRDVSNLIADWKQRLTDKEGQV